MRAIEGSRTVRAKSRAEYGFSNIGKPFSWTFWSKAKSGL